jgi:NADPH-dependent glutamate synthase beta subunit-like oxidoreductase
LITKADKVTGRTSRPGVFSGGDCVTGPDLVVTAMVARVEKLRLQLMSIEKQGIRRFSNSCRTTAPAKEI